MTRRIAIALLVLLAALPALARTKLAALPEREAVSVRFDNPAGTLVSEERVLTLQEGENLVDFSWRGVAVNPDSIILELLSHPDKVTLLSVGYPPGEAALTWRIHSPAPLEEKVRITYLLSAIDRLVAYKGVASKDEKTLTLSAYLILRNFSGEDFPRANFNLGQGAPFKGSMAHEETRQLLFFSAAGIPVRKILAWDSATMEWEPSRLDVNVGLPLLYEIANTREAGLGTSLFWDGKARIFQEDQSGSSIFLGEDRLKLTPVGEKARLSLGVSRDVTVTQFKTRDEVTTPRPSRQSPVLFDTIEAFEVTVESFKDDAVTVEVTEHVEGEWKMASSSHAFEKKDANTILYTVNLAPRQKVKLSFEYNRLNVRN